MATIQTTQLEERETGDIKQLRDHDIAEGPVSTNSADATSLKSVPLTLEDGSIIKVRFDSLVTAIGQALGASEDSTVTKVLGLNGTVPKGIGMANLASVLGGVGMIISYEGYIDYKEVASLPVGIYTTSNASVTTGMPAELGSHAAIVFRALYGTGGLIATVAIDIEGNLGVYTRRHDGTNWIKQ